MAKMDLITTMMLESANFEKGINQAKQKTQEMKTAIVGHSKEMKEGVSTLGETFSKVGTTIGNVGGEIMGAMATIMSATSPLLILVSAIAMIGEAWQKSTENIKEYLKEEEKAKYGAAAFIEDSKAAMKDTEKRLKGGMAEGGRLQAMANQALLAKNLTEEDKKQLNIMLQTGKQMVEDNAKMYQTLGLTNDENALLKNGYDWKKKYSDLLLKNELLDKEKIKQSGELNTLEAELLTIKTKISEHNTNAVEKQKLEKEYEEKAAVIRDKKLDLVSREYDVKSQLFQMTGKNEQAELLTLNTENQKAEIQRAYNQDIFQTVRLQNKVNSEQQKQVASADELLRIQKELNTHTEAGYKLSPLKVSQNSPALDNELGKGLKARISNIDLTRLAKYTGLTNDETKAIQKQNKELEKQAMWTDVLQSSIGGVTDAMSKMITGTKGGFNDLITTMLGGIQKVINGLLAEAIAAAIAHEAHKGLLGLITAAVAVAGVMALWQKVPAFADGGISGGGWSLVGERGPELVNLPRGAQVFSNSQSTGMFGGGELTTRVSGSDLIFVLNNAQRKSNSYR